MNIELLEEIGLTKSEIKVYLALLELGSTTTGKIVEKSKASSSKIYEILDKLINKGLASYIIKSGTKYFEAADPKRILDYLQEKQAKLSEQTKEIKELIPELELKQKLSEEKSETLVFKGMKGAETAFNDILNYNQELLVAGFAEVPEPFQNFLLKFHKKRAKKGINARMLNGPKLMRLGEEFEKLSHTKWKIYPGESAVAIITYGDKTLFSLPEDSIWIQVKNKRLADANKERFEEIWNQDVKVYKGFQAVTDRFAAMRDELKKGEAYSVLGATYGQGGQKLRDWFRDYHQKRTKKGVIAKLLTVSHDYEQVKKTLQTKNDPEMKFAEIKRLPPDFSSPMQITLYKNNKVLMMLFGKEMVCFEVESKQLHDNFKNYFNALWNQETQVLKGLDAIQNLFEEMLEHKHGDLIGARGYFLDKRPKFADKWEKLAKEKGFTMRNIVDPETKGHRITKFSFAKTKYTIPKEFTHLSVYWIFGDKVAISNWMGDEPIVLVIENKRLHDMYQKQFELMWKKKII